MPSSANQNHGEGKSSEQDSQVSQSLTTFALSENQRGELLLTRQAHQLTTGGGKPGQGYPAVVWGWMDYGSDRSIEPNLMPPLKEDNHKMKPLIFSVGDSPAKTSALPGEELALPEISQDCSLSLQESLELFDLDTSSLKTYPVSSLVTAVETSERSLKRWPTSGMAWLGGFSTADSSECRSADGVCSSSEPSLTEILEPPQSVPDKYSLSARGAAGILRRAKKRGRTIPPPLLAALEAAAQMTTTPKPDDS